MNPEAITDTVMKEWLPQGKKTSLWCSYYLLSSDDNHLEETLILSLFTSARKALEVGKKSEKLAAMFS